MLITSHSITTSQFDSFVSLLFMGKFYPKQCLITILPRDVFLPIIVLEFSFQQIAISHLLSVSHQQRTQEEQNITTFAQYILQEQVEQSKQYMLANNPILGQCKVFTGQSSQILLQGNGQIQAANPCDLFQLQVKKLSRFQTPHPYMIRL